MEFETNSFVRQQQNVNTDINQRENERQREQVSERQQGKPAGNFQFEVQKERIEQVLQRPRSREYLAALDMIDFLSSDDEEIISRLKEQLGTDFVEELEEMTDEEIFEMITQAFHEEFEELETNLDDTLIAVLSTCSIRGCDCHAIDQEGHIIEHYYKNKKMPEDLEWGRKILSTHQNKCQCVEVYKTCCRLISFHGDVTVIKK